MKLLKPIWLFNAGILAALQIRSSYGNHYRRMVAKILSSITFCSNNIMHQPILDALRWLENHKNSNIQYVPFSSR